MANLKTLLQSTECWNTAGETSINGFQIEGTQPDGSRRSFIFSVDDRLVKFDGNNIVDFEHALTAENVLFYGNTADELAAVTSIPAWLGKKIYPVIALDCPQNSDIRPTAKISLLASSVNDIYAKDFYSPVFNFKLSGLRAKIIDADIFFDTAGAATCLKYIRIKNNDVWEDWTSPANVKFKYGVAAQFKVRAIVSTFNGNDRINFTGAKISYTTDDVMISGTTTEIFTIPEDVKYPLGSCRALIRHDKLQDAKISADAIYFSEKILHENISIGTGTGSLQTLTLPAEFINQDSLKISADGNILENFFYNTKTSEIQLTAPQGSNLTATFESGFTQKNIIPLEIESTYTDGKIFTTRFTADEETDKKIAAIVYKIETFGGSVSENFGLATGDFQTFTLEHRATKESMTCTGSWIYDEDKQILTVKQTEDTEIILNYDFVGKAPIIFEYAAGWSAAT